MKSDETLFLEFAQGQEKSLLELIQRYEKKLYGFLYRYLGDAHKAEDLFQDVFLLVLTKYKTFDRTKTFRPWLFTLAANLARDELRKHKRQKDTLSFEGAPKVEGEWEPMEPVDSSWEDPLLHLEKSEQEQFLLNGLSQLSAEQRECLLLFHFEDLKYKEISEILDVPLGTVKSRIFNGTKQLLARLQPQSISE